MTGQAGSPHFFWRQMSRGTFLLVQGMLSVHYRWAPVFSSFTSPCQLRGRSARLGPEVDDLLAPCRPLGPLQRQRVPLCFWNLGSECFSRFCTRPILKRLEWLWQQAIAPGLARPYETSERLASFQLEDVTRPLGRSCSLRLRRLIV